MGFPRREYWSWLPFLPQRDLPDPEIEIMSLTSPSLSGVLFTTSITWEGPERKESLVIKKKKNDDVTFCLIIEAKDIDLSSFSVLK